MVNNFIAADTGYAPAYFRLLTEKTLYLINHPVMGINIDAYISTLNDKYSGEVRLSSDQTELRPIFNRIISELYDVIGTSFLSEIAKYKEQMSRLKDEFADQLLEEMNADFKS